MKKFFKDIGAFLIRYLKLAGYIVFFHLIFYGLTLLGTPKFEALQSVVIIGLSVAFLSFGDYEKKLKESEKRHQEILNKMADYLDRE